ncbi:MAG: uL15 family ribosomal protein [Patescibacteria group bacterium]|nr:uL15 family ribosomal protein [Patescibacteria group bacterium]
MQLHQLKSSFNKKSRKRVGRGGKKGTYSGRGMKGQKARAGGKPRAGFAGGDTSLVKRLPKQRGQIGKTEIKKGTKLFRLKVKPVIFNLNDFNKKFFAKDGSSFIWTEKEVVSPKNLLKKGLISKTKGRVPAVKILGVGRLKKKLNFSGVALSKSAKKKLGIEDSKKVIKKNKVIPKAKHEVAK